MITVSSIEGRRLVPCYVCRVSGQYAQLKTGVSKYTDSATRCVALFNYSESCGAHASKSTLLQGMEG